MRGTIVRQMTSRTQQGAQSDTRPLGWWILKRTDVGASEREAYLVCQETDMGEPFRGASGEPREMDSCTFDLDGDRALNVRLTGNRKHGKHYPPESYTKPGVNWADQLAARLEEGAK